MVNEEKQSLQSKEDSVCNRDAVSRELKSFSCNVINLCDKKGITVQELSKETGVPLYLLSKLKNGIVAKNFVVKHLILICNYFEVLPSELFEDE